MYFNEKNNTNIDDELNSGNIFLFLKKYRIFIIGLVILVIIGVLFLILNNNIIFKDVKNYLVLNGDEVIKIYEGTDYVEPGFEAYNSNEENLINDVVVNSDLNNKKAGEYEISYMLGDIIKIRKIIVVERPSSLTYIYLNSVDDSVDIYLKIGDEYVEPGYKVFSSSSEDLTDRVEVVGFVDTNKKGSYKLIYSVIDNNGVIVSKTRMVYVIEMDIDLSLSTSEWTNKNVDININIEDEFFDYMILPDDTRIKQKRYKYEAYKNGRYSFKVYNNKGMVSETFIDVLNIDKDIPNGSCVVDHNENGSFITVNVKDDSGIKNYQYNGKKYNNNKIVLDEYINSASVLVYDNAGNSNKLNCKVLEINDEFFVDKSHYTDMTGFNVNDIKTTSVDLTDIGCGVTLSAGSGVYRQSIRVHQKISNDFHGILTNVCKYINKSFWISELQTAGAYVDRENTGLDYHAMGLAIDLNNEWSYTFNGKKYRPYPYQGELTWQAYNEFVCDVCDGKEDCEYNVNYIIYKRYFEGNGWCWGGNWSINNFDPMHYEIRKDNKCAIGRTQKISC